MVQFYKLLFNIKPPDNPENWTTLERQRQQLLAELEPERLQVISRLIADINVYISSLAHTPWKQQDKLEQLISLQGLQALHTKMHIGDIKGIPKHNGKPEDTIQAWRPIMCLDTIRKIITKILSNRTYQLIQTSDYSMCCRHYNSATKKQPGCHRPSTPPNSQCSTCSVKADCPSKSSLTLQRLMTVLSGTSWPTYYNSKTLKAQKSTSS